MLSSTFLLPIAHVLMQLVERHRPAFVQAREDLLVLFKLCLRRLLHFNHQERIVLSIIIWRGVFIKATMKVTVKVTMHLTGILTGFNAHVPGPWSSTL